MNFLAVITGYILGSIPFGYLVCKYWKEINILEYGSGNIGFTNVLRSAGWPPAALVLIGDVSKGALAAYLGIKTGGVNFGIFCGLAAMVGHSFSIFLKFRGGKLVATGLGVLLVLAPEAAAVAVVTWFLALALTRYVSLSSILASISLLPSMFMFRESNSIKIFFVLVAGFIIYRHKSNIQKLLNGTEFKIGQKADRK